MTSRPTLQEKQKEHLLSLLRFNTKDSNSKEWAEDWKVLIYDKAGRDIISPLLKLHELRQQGVTLHLLLSATRDALPDVPAIYFIAPTDDNITRLAQDAAAGLYRRFHVNFISPAPRGILEKLAALTVETGVSDRIHKVYDQHLDFTCLAPKLFTLGHPTSYYHLHRPDVMDADMESMLESIVSALFSTCMVSGTLPILRFNPSRESPSYTIAHRLASRLSEQVSSMASSLLLASDAGPRPLLILVDRQDDLASALHHPSTYQALVDDLLTLSQNRVRVGDKTYDLDITSDPFFAAHAMDLFPDAIAANETALAAVTAQEQACRESATSDTTLSLMQVVDTLPALLEQKKRLEVHTNLFQAAFELVAERHIPTYSMLEDKLMRNNRPSGSTSSASVVPLTEVMDLCREKGTCQDKERLCCIDMVTQQRSEEECLALEKALREADIDPSQFHAWQGVRSLSSRNKSRAALNLAIPSSLVSFTTESTAGGDDSPAAKANTYFNQLAGNFAGQASGWLATAAASVKQFLPTDASVCLVTEITAALCRNDPSNTTNTTMGYLDPKVLNFRAASSSSSSSSSTFASRSAEAFTHATVFCIGGATYHEWSNLQTFAKNETRASRQSSSPHPTSRRVITFGMTELVNPETFLSQLHQLP